MDVIETEDVDQESDVETIEDTPSNLNDAINSVNLIRKFIYQSNVAGECSDLVNRLENELYNSRYKCLRQSKITDYVK